MNLTDSKCYADSMAFYELQKQPPIFDPKKRPMLSLAHLTSVPPVPKFKEDFGAALDAHKEFRAQALSNPDTHEVLTRADLDKPGMGLMFGLQHAPADLSVERVRQLYNVGVRSMALAYDDSSEYGDGFKNPDGRLTSRGKELIKWMTRCGIILDLSHAGHITALDAANFVYFGGLSTKLMLSHSGLSGVFEHPRNVSDVILDRIADRDGYIGIPALTFILCHKDGDYLNAFVRHVESAIIMVGRERVGIGSDCNHLDMTMEEARVHYENMTKNILQTGGSFGEYFPDRPPLLIHHGSKMFWFLEKILECTFSKETVRGFCGENFKAFLRRSLPWS